MPPSNRRPARPVDVEATGAPPPIRLYGFVVFAAAWLVFWVQPLAVRGILPVLGGSAAVWNTAMVFFQSALLAGYALAHFLMRRASPRGQLALLAILWTCAALTAPVGGLRLFGEVPGALAPALWLLGTLAGALGLAFVAAATLTPLVQAWLARAGAGAASSDPYFLYAASNAGSAGALLAYPFLIEPFIGLERQAWTWSAALLGLAPFLFMLWRALPGPRAAPPLPAAAPSSESRHPEPLPVGRILALSAAPSALLLGVTRYLSTDVASVPLLWTVPLALYLGTFVHAFARRQLVPHHVLARLLPAALIALAILFALTRSVFAFGLVHLLVFTVAALYCHGALARLRPPPAGLTRFYLLLSTGGLIGGLARRAGRAARLRRRARVSDRPRRRRRAPASGGVRPSPRPPARRRARARLCIVGGLAVVVEEFVGFDDGLPLLVAGMFALIALAGPALLVLRAKPVLLAGALLAVFLVPSAISQRDGEHVARERTFFGVYRVIERDGKRSFFHGTTMHGAEWPRPDGSIESRTTYYGPETPLGDLFSALARRPSPLVIGLAGLGTGSLACYARPGDEVRIYEIDPVVVQLARTYFAALRDLRTGCAGRHRRRTAPYRARIAPPSTS